MLFGIFFPVLHATFITSYLFQSISSASSQIPQQALDVLLPSFPRSKNPFISCLKAAHSTPFHCLLCSGDICGWNTSGTNHNLFSRLWKWQFLKHIIAWAQSQPSSPVLKTSHCYSLHTCWVTQGLFWSKNLSLFGSACRYQWKKVNLLPLFFYLDFENVSIHFVLYISVLLGRAALMGNGDKCLCQANVSFVCSQEGHSSSASMILSNITAECILLMPSRTSQHISSVMMFPLCSNIFFNVSFQAIHFSCICLTFSVVDTELITHLRAQNSSPSTCGLSFFWIISLFLSDPWLLSQSSIKK